MQTELYTLPEIQFVGGETQHIYFHCRRKRDGAPYNLLDATVTFSLLNYSFKNGIPLLEKGTDILMGVEGVPNVVHLELDPADTNMMYGKYVYQLIFVDKEKYVEVPRQGILFLAKNINQGYINSNIHKYI